MRPAMQPQDSPTRTSPGSTYNAYHCKSSFFCFFVIICDLALALHVVGWQIKLRYSHAILMVRECILLYRAVHLRLIFFAVRVRYGTHAPPPPYRHSPSVALPPRFRDLGSSSAGVDCRSSATDHRDLRTSTTTTAAAAVASQQGATHSTVSLVLTAVLFFPPLSLVGPFERCSRASRA